MARVALQQVTSKFARDNAGRTLEHPVGLQYVKRLLKPEKVEALEHSCDEGRVYVWGAKLERGHQFEKMHPGRCLVLFRRGGMVYKCGKIIELAGNIDLAEYLWGRDTDGETWPLIYFFKDIKDLSIPARDINSRIGRQAGDHWQGLVAVLPPAADEVIEYVKARLAQRSSSSV